VRDRLAAAAPPLIAKAARATIATARRIGYARARLPRPIGTRPPVELAVCAIFRDEAPNLAEWVTFHRLQGVERFWLYDNLSKDNWSAELGPELESGVVTVTPWPDVPGQLSAYADALSRHRDEARWIAFIDIDEFLFSPPGRSLPEVLRDYDGHPGVVANWRMYGTNGHQEPPDGLVIENYLLRGPDSQPDNGYVKSIAYPRKVVGLHNAPHSFSYRGTAVSEDHQPASHFREPPTADLLRINHYYARSLADLTRKRARPSAVDGVLGETAEVPPDEVYDETILQFVPALKDALARRRRSDQVATAKAANDV
jgi:hypothetical protein